MGPPVDIGDADAVCLNDKVYIGGGVTSGSFRYAARLYIYTPATDEWTTLDTPVCWFGLTIYHSQLVLVGGREYVGENVFGGDFTNKLWTLSEDGQWQETLPPMPTLCGTYASAVSHGDHLLVISNDHPTNKVYVYNGHHWASAQHPPQQLNSIRSTVFDGDWCVMESRGIVYSASLDSLLASCEPSETSQPSSLWKRLTIVPSQWCYPVVFGSRLVAVGRGSTDNLSLHAYSSLTQSWVHMADAPISLISNIFDCIPTPCAILLPSNELMIMSEQTAFKYKLTCKFIII
ncbi:MAG: hypothetical protein MJE68_13285 [Proteobacteria bacterium]|nr:hypothetical protein [Pseudomonadota bacterium]